MYALFGFVPGIGDCDAYAKVTPAIYVIAQMGINAIFCLRNYAIYNRSRKILTIAVLSTVILAGFAVAC